MRYQVKIETQENGQIVVTINGNPVYYALNKQEASAFIAGIFYDGYPREKLYLDYQRNNFS